MKRALIFGIVGLFLVSATGCGASGPDGLMKEQISLMNDLASAIEKKDKDKIKSIAEKLKANEEKLNKLNLSQEEKEKLQKKYEGEAKEAMGRMLQAMMTAGPELGDVLKDIK